MASLDIYIVTFNCGRALVDPPALSSGLFQALPRKDVYPDILVLCLEEIAPIAYSYLGGSFLAPYFSRLLETIKFASRGKQNYRHVLSRNVGMTGIILFAKPGIADNIQWLETAGVGVGITEMGNKGAVGVRLGLLTQEQERLFEVTFVAAHLAPMEDAVDRRNEDWKNIVRGMAFAPATERIRTSTAQRIIALDDDEADPLLPKETTVRSMFSPKTILFFGGDLNYRSKDIGPEPKDVTSFPQPTNDTSSPLHFSHLLSSEQLRREQDAGRTLHHLSEGPINFPPTYKYSDKQFELDPPSLSANNIPEEPKYYHWASHRYPSWTDRILFSSFLVHGTKTMGRNSPIKIHKYTALPIQPTSDHRPVALSLSLDVAAAMQASKAAGFEAEPPFQLNLNWQSQREWARRREVMVGLGAYLTTTWEGRGLLIAIVVGSLGGWLVLGSLIEGWSYSS